MLGALLGFSFEKDDSFEFPENPGKMWTLYLRKMLDEVDMNYLLIDKSEYWVDLSIYNKFPKLKSMVSNLPFKNVSRIFFMFNKESVKSEIHFDHNMEDWRQEFIWFRMNEAKKFWNTPFDELIAQGYGVIEDPKSALKAELKEVQSKPWFPGQGGMIKKLKKQLNK